MKNTIYQSAVAHFGERNQLEMMQEEALELALAVRRFARHRKYEQIEEIASEIADVQIMIEQLKVIFKEDLFADLINEKMAEKTERLFKLITFNN